MAGAIPDIVITLTANVEDFIRDWNRAADAAERAAARIAAAGAAAGNGPGGGPDASRFRDLNAELDRLTRTARAAADSVRDLGNENRRAAADVEEFRRRLGELGGSLGSVSGGFMRGGAMGKIFAAAIAVLLSILPGIIAGIFALGAAATGIVMAFGVAALGARGLGQAFDRLQAAIKPLQAQLDSVFRVQLGAEFAKLGQTITSQLTPAFKGVARAISDMIKETTQWIRSAEGISTIKTAMQGVEDLVRALGPAVKGIVQIFVEFGAAAAPAMKAIGDAISEVVIGLRDMFREAQKSGQLQKIFEAGAEAIKGFGEILKGVIMILMEMADQGGLPAAEAMKKFGKALQDAAPAIGALFANLARAAEVIATVIGWLAKFGDVVANIINPIRALQKAFPEATKGMESFGAGFKKVFTELPKIVTAGVVKAGVEFKKWVDKTVADAKALPQKVLQAVKEWWDKTTAEIKQGVDKANTAIKQWVDKSVQTVKELPAKIAAVIKEWWDKTVADIKAGVDKAIEETKAFVQKCIDALKEMPSKAAQVGKDMVNGLIDGAKGQAGQLIATFKAMATAALAAAKAALGIRSPSQVFADEVGAHIPAGIAAGIRAGAPALNAALAASMRQLPMTANVALSSAAGRGAALGMSASSKQVIEVKFAASSGGDGVMGQAFAKLARTGQMKLTANAIVGGR